MTLVCSVEPEGIDVGLIAGVAALSILGIGLLTVAVIAVLAVAVKFRAKLLPSVFGPGVRSTRDHSFSFSFFNFQIIYSPFTARLRERLRHLYGGRASR